MKVEDECVFSTALVFRTRKNFTSAPEDCYEEKLSHFLCNPLAS
ncbi:unnamed protein product [Amoebophrya sp. A25]|nr:unnamed protein product [Amoebophrya sp. A25]|eukprot:GSA25T00013516001.1